MPFTICKKAQFLLRKLDSFKVRQEFEIIEIIVSEGITYQCFHRVSEVLVAREKKGKMGEKMEK